MFLSKLVFTPGAPGERLKGLRWQNPYSFHQWLWQLLPEQPQAPATFLYRADRFANTPVIQLLSEHPPLAEVADWQVETKLFNPKLKPGQLLQFSLRANPTITLSLKGVKRKRHDVLMHAKKNSAKEESFEAMYRAASQWLENRQNALGIELQLPTVQMDNYQQLVFKKPDANADDNLIQLSSLDYSGVCKVSDASKLRDVLKTGVGPAKRFGCGLLLVRLL